MSAIIAALLAAFGPMLADLLLNWLKSIFSKAEKNLKGHTFSSSARASVALVDEAIRITPKAAVGKRLLLRFIRNHAATVAQGFPLPASAADEIKDAAQLAK